MNNEKINELIWLSYDVKNYADVQRCCQPLPWPSALVDYIHLDLHNSSHPPQPPSIIAEYFLVLILYTLTKVNRMYNQEQAVKFTKRMSMMV